MAIKDAKRAWLCEDFGCFAHDHTALKTQLTRCGRAGMTETTCATCGAVWRLEPIRVVT